MLPADLVAKLADCAKTDFIATRDIWSFRQVIFSWLVIIGLALEGPEVWYDILHIARTRVSRFRYRIVILDHRVELAKVIAFVGWIFIIGGLLGELRAGSKITNLSTSIQVCSDAKVQAATLEAGDAATSAKTARDAADGVSATARELADELLRFRTEAGARRLSAEQQESLRNAIEAMPTPIAIGHYPTDSEAADFASDLFAVLNSARWPVVNVIWIPNGKYGLFIGFVDKEGFDTPQFKLLHHALEQAHCPASPLLLKAGDTSFLPPAESHVMYLLVATHPPINAKVR